MAKRKRRKGAGIRQRVITPKATYTKQRTKTGRTVYRKNGRFTSKRSYVAAKASKSAQIENSELSVALDTDAYERQGRRANTKWVKEDGSTPYGRAGVLAQELFPELERGDPLTKLQRSELYRNMRLVHGFETFWHHRFPELSREEAENRFEEMIEKLRKVRSRTARDDIREEYGLDRYEDLAG